MRPALVALTLLTLARPAVGQGKLQRSRQEPARQPAAAGEADDKRPPCPDEEDDVLGELFGPVLGQAFAAVIAAPFVVPARLLGDHIEREALFPGHPYARPEGGFLDPSLRPDAGGGTSFRDPQYLKPWSVRLALENGNDFDGLNRTGAHLAFDTSFRLGLSSRWDHYRERLAGGGWDHTTLGDAHLTFRFAQGRAAQFHAGLGGRWRFDRHDTSGGVSFLYGADIFPFDPLVLSAAVDLGNLDRQFVFRARASTGWQVGRCELLGGYDFLRLGPVNLQGPFVGLRLWF